MVGKIFFYAISGIACCVLVLSFSGIFKILDNEHVKVISFISALFFGGIPNFIKEINSMYLEEFKNDEVSI